MQDRHRPISSAYADNPYEPFVREDVDREEARRKRCYSIFIAAVIFALVSVGIFMGGYAAGREHHHHHQQHDHGEFETCCIFVSYVF